MKLVSRENLFFVVWKVLCFNLVLKENWTKDNTMDKDGFFDHVCWLVPGFFRPFFPPKLPFSLLKLYIFGTFSQPKQTFLSWKWGLCWPQIRKCRISFTGLWTGLLNLFLNQWTVKLLPLTSSLINLYTIHCCENIFENEIRIQSWSISLWLYSGLKVSRFKYPFKYKTSRGSSISITWLKRFCSFWI